MASSRRVQASWRFIDCERESCTVTAWPVGRCLSCTDVETLFTCWPPGPEERANFSSKSSTRRRSRARRAGGAGWKAEVGGTGIVWWGGVGGSEGGAGGLKPPDNRAREII